MWEYGFGVDTANLNPLLNCSQVPLLLWEKSFSFLSVYSASGTVQAIYTHYLISSLHERSRVPFFVNWETESQKMSNFLQILQIMNIRAVNSNLDLSDSKTLFQFSLLSAASNAHLRNLWRVNDIICVKYAVVASL